MSLKLELTNLIQSYYPDYCPFDVIERKTKELGYRQSNSERRLRPSESPFVREIKNDKGYIIGYQYNPPEKFKPYISDISSGIQDTNKFIVKKEIKPQQQNFLDLARHI